MATKYKGSVKLPAGLSKMGGGDYKLIDANDINIYSELSTEGEDRSLTSVIDDLYTTLHSKPVLSYVDEQGYREGETKYWNLGNDMFIKFAAYIPSGTMNVTIYRDGVLFLAQTMASSEYIVIPLGTATRDGQVTYTVTAISTLGEKADKTLVFKQVVGSLTINTTFDSQTIRNSGPGSSNNIEVPFDIIYASNVNRFDITAILKKPNGERLDSQSTYKIGPATHFESVINFNNIELPEAGKYTIELIGTATLGTGSTTETSKILSFSALTANTVAAILQETNMQGETDSDTALYISYSVETNIEAFKSLGALTATIEIFEETSPGVYDRKTKEFFNRGATAGSSYSLSIGRLSGGEEEGESKNYKYVVTAFNSSTSEGYSKQTSEGVFSVKNTSAAVDPVENDLFTFDATNIDPIRQTNEMWYSTNYNPEAPLGNTYYKIPLHNINGRTTGFLQDERGEDWGNYLKLDGDAWGKIVKSDPQAVGDEDFHPFEKIASDDGFTFEVMVNTRNIGIKDAIAVICGEADKTFAKLGFKIDYSSLKMTATNPCSTSFAENNWTHIVFVVDKIIYDNKTDLDNIERLNPQKSINIYINGIRSSINTITDADIRNDTEHGVYLNCCNDSGEIKNFGETGLKLIRCYNKPLNAQDVLKNYYNALYNVKKVETEKAKNSLYSTPIPTLIMIRNKWKDSLGTETYADASKAGMESETWNSRYDKKAMNEIPFRDLNGIKVKADSKNHRTNCTVWYVWYDEDKQQHVRKWDDVDVFLQGTSSLVYPVKNYKFKIYETKESPTGYEPLHCSRKYKGGKGKKLKTIPFNKTIEVSGKDKGIDGWYVKDNTFTLKCDYMEQSHKNNTPTAMYFEKVVEAVNNAIGDDGLHAQFTIAKDKNIFKNYSTIDPVTHAEMPAYRDGIQGFPILLYFDENDIPGLDNNEERVSAGSFIYPSTIQYVGSYMFNTDKGSNTLGFDISTAESGDDQVIIQNVQDGRFAIDENEHYIFDGLVRKDDDKYYITDPLDLDKPINERAIMKDINGNDLSIGSLPMVSLEGKSNSSGATAATWYTLFEANNENYILYIERKYYTDLTRQQDAGHDNDSQSYAVKENSYLYLIWADPTFAAYKTYFKNNENIFREAARRGDLEDLLHIIWNDPSYDPMYTTYHTEYATEEEFKTAAKAGQISGLADFKKVLSFDNFYTNAKANTLQPEIPNNIWTDMSYDVIKVYSFKENYANKEPTSYYNARYTTETAELILSSDDYEYVKRTFEIRWAYSEEVDLSGKIQRNDDDYEIKDKLDFNPILYTLNWFKDLADLSDSARKTKFRDEFKKHFSYAYAMTYYLQMMMFIQVDNPGKNAMFDQWGDGRWYVRPYDMDTQMGLDNSGLSTIPVGAEINPVLSPTATTVSPVDIYFSTKNTWDKEPRVIQSYNTTNSRLWIWFGKYFKNEIENIYAALRNNGIYTSDSILKFVESVTSDIIGQTFYNKDGAIKYLTQDLTSETLQRFQGCRECSYKQILADRLVFLDSFFNAYKLDKSKTKFNTLSLRSDAGNVTVPIIISTYSPTYIKIVVDDGTLGTSYVYIDPDTYYVDPDDPSGQTKYPGVRFDLQLSGSDKGIEIYGLESIVQIKYLENLNLRKFDATNGIIKMTEINLSGSSNLNGFIPGNSEYLRQLDLSYCNGFGTGSQPITTVDTSQCPKLEEIHIEGSGGITGLNLAEGSPLKYINFSNTGITEIKLESLSYLTDENFIYENCNNMKTFKINNCPQLTNLMLSGYPALRTVSITNCTGVKKIVAQSSILSELNLNGSVNIEQLDFSQCTEWAKNFPTSNPKWYKLDLHDQSNLKVLNISYSGNYLNKILLIIPATGFANMTNFNAKHSSLSTISTTRTSYDDVDEILDFTGFPENNSSFALNIQECFYCRKIKNLKYTGNLDYFFNMGNNNSLLNEFENCSLTSTSTNGRYMFGYCRNLKGGAFANANITFNLTTITNFTYGLYNCGKLLITDIKNILSAMPNVQNLSNLRDLWTYDDDKYGARSSLALTSSLFENNHRITSLSGAFSHNKIDSISAGLFKHIKYTENGTTVYPLTSISSMFQWQATNSLQNGVPYNMFAEDDNDKACINVTSLKFFFGSANQFPGFKNGSNYTLNIKYPANNKVTDLSFMFMNCSTLKNTQDGSTLKSFFDKFPLAQNISLVFGGGTKASFVTSVPNGVFNSCPNLTKIQGAFAGITSLETLPDYLFTNNSNESNKWPSLTMAGGLFANCTKLRGTKGTGTLSEQYFITKDLFFGAPNISKLGRLVYNYGGSTYILPGAFANTAVEGIEPDFLSLLPNLADISLLFAKGNIDGQKFVVTNNHVNCTKFKTVIYNDRSNYDDTGLIPINIFAANNKLTDVSYVFAGNMAITGFGKENSSTYTRIPDDESDTINLFTTSAKTNTLVYAQGLFEHCELLSCELPNYLFTDCKKLQTLEGCFADCMMLTGRIKYAKNAQNEDDPLAIPPLFRNCTSLQNAKKMFYRCQLLDGTTGETDGEILPSKLFGSCKGTIKNLDSLFYGCTELKGRFLPEIPVLITEGTYTAEETIKAQSEEEEDQKYILTIILNKPTETFDPNTGERTELSGTGTFKYKLNVTGAEEHTESITYFAPTDGLEYKNIIKFNATNINSAQLEKVDYEIAIHYANDTFACTKETMPTGDSITNCKKTSGTKYTISKPGLLSDCLNLTNTHYMFAGCINLFGAIPQDLFFSSNGNPYKNLSDISGMFLYCKCLGLLKAEREANRSHVYSFDPREIGTEYLFPEDWLQSCTALTTIKELFKGACIPLNDWSNRYVHNNIQGNDYADDNWIKIQTTLPNSNPFRSASIKDASYAFAGNQMIGLNRISNTFWSSSRTSIQNASRMFMLSTLPGAGTSTSNALFSDGCYSLIDVSYMFYHRTADQIKDTICFFDPTKYNTKIVSTKRTNFISREFKPKVNNANFNALEAGGYAPLTAVPTEQLISLLGSPADIKTPYTDNVVYNNWSPSNPDAS